MRFLIGFPTGYSWMEIEHKGAPVYLSWIWMLFSRLYSVYHNSMLSGFLQNECKLSMRIRCYPTKLVSVHAILSLWLPHNGCYICSWKDLHAHSKKKKKQVCGGYYLLVNGIFYRIFPYGIFEMRHVYSFNKQLSFYSNRSWWPQFLFSKLETGQQFRVWWIVSRINNLNPGFLGTC